MRGLTAHRNTIRRFTLGSLYVRAVFARCSLYDRCSLHLCSTYFSASLFSFSISIAYPRNKLLVSLFSQKMEMESASRRICFCSYTQSCASVFRLFTPQKSRLVTSYNKKNDQCIKAYLLRWFPAIFEKHDFRIPSKSCFGKIFWQPFVDLINSKCYTNVWKLLNLSDLQKVAKTLFINTILSQKSALSVN